ncbi:transposase [Myxococcota bacterium]|nr:transposase [Myxococcota bacterium]
MMPDFPQRKSFRLPSEIYRTDFIFFVTINTADRYPWFETWPELAETAEQSLRNIADQRSSDLFAWCIMPDHLHILLRDENLVDFIRLFKGRLVPVARQKRSDKLWQRSFYDHAVRKEDSLSDISHYIWDNPVRAGLAREPLKYRWSGSLSWPDWRNSFK